MQALYQEQLNDHYRTPRNRGRIDSPSFSSGQYNPSCGDTVLIEGLIQGDVVTRVLFDGSGCVISQATASLLTEKVIGLSCDAIGKMDSETITNLIGMALGPVRLKCALLPLLALQAGIVNYQKDFK